jgi:hypothetical protein
MSKRGESGNHAAHVCRRALAPAPDPYLLRLLRRPQARARHQFDGGRKFPRPQGNRVVGSKNLKDAQIETGIS